jgi:transcriptional regulator with XRE-family HTH domain
VPLEADNRVLIGRRIKEIRVAQEMTLQELAKKSDVSAGFISEVERGLVSISTPKLMDICEALGVSTADVLNDRPRPAPMPGTVEIPSALSEVADRMNLPHRVVLQLLGGKQSLTARRSHSREQEWGPDEWLKFFNQVREFIDNEEDPADGSKTRDRSRRAPPG